jgi:ribosome-associated protein
MPTALEGARKSTPPPELVPTHGSEALLGLITAWLDEAKAEKVVAIDIRWKSSIGDYMVIASGRSDRHVGAIADQLHKKLKEAGHARVRLEGQPQCDWVLIDTGDIIVHVFRPEVREFYNLEKMWAAERPSPSDATTH